MPPGLPLLTATIFPQGGLKAPRWGTRLVTPPGETNCTVTPTDPPVTLILCPEVSPLEFYGANYDGVIPFGSQCIWHPITPPVRPRSGPARLSGLMGTDLRWRKIGKIGWSQ